jgi:hypothetical protein
MAIGDQRLPDLFPQGRIRLRPIVSVGTVGSVTIEVDAVSCKVCGGDAPLYGVVDFNKSCEQFRGIRFAPAGIAVWYHRCLTCGFLFTDLCDSWTSAQFAERIYNEDYVMVDPEYVAKRPANNAKVLRQLFDAEKALIKLLDYGGGNGDTARDLRLTGFACDSWDPFGAAPREPPLAQSYDVVTCFEVIEHAHDPLGTVEDVMRLVRADGIVIFSTMVQPELTPPGSLDWWYIAPRNGHVAIHTEDSLRRLWRKVGMSVASFGTTMHVAFKDRIPEFARILYRVSGVRGLPELPS